MFKNDNLLSPQDKLFLLNNTHLFSLPNRTFIRSHNLEWMGEIEEKLSGDEIRLLTGKHQKSGFVISTLTDIPGKHGVENSRLNEILFFFSQNLLNYPCDLQSDLNEVMKFIIQNLNMIAITLDSKKEEERKCLNSLFYSIFMEGIKPRILAHEIYLHGTLECVPGDEYLRHMTLQEASTLIDEFLDSKDVNYIAFTICMILKYFHLEKTLDNINPFTDYKFYRDEISFHDGKRIEEMILNCDEDKVGILDMISGINEGLYRKDFDYRIIIYGKERLIDDYIKTHKIITRETEKTVSVGDAVKDEETLKSKCFNQIQYLSNSELFDIMKDVCDVVNKPGEFDFTLTERQNAILIVDNQFKLTKICNKESSDFRTIIEYNGDMYLCFRICGDRNIHALSIPDDMMDERKYLIIEDNPNVEFKLKNCEV